MIDQNFYYNNNNCTQQNQISDNFKENIPKQPRRQSTKKLNNRQKFYDNKENLQVLTSQNTIPTESSKYSQYSNMSLEKLLKNKTARQVAQELTYGNKRLPITKLTSVQTSQQSNPFTEIQNIIASPQQIGVTQSVSNANQFFKKVNGSSNFTQGFYSTSNNLQQKPSSQQEIKVLMEITQQSLNQLDGQKKLQQSLSEQNMKAAINSSKQQQQQQFQQLSQQSQQENTQKQIEEQQIIMQKIKEFRESLQLAKGGKIEDAFSNTKQIQLGQISCKNMNNDTLLSNAFSKMQTPTNQNERIIQQQFNSNNLFTLSEDTQFKRKNPQSAEEICLYPIHMPTNTSLQNPKILNSQFNINVQQPYNAGNNLHQSKSAKTITQPSPAIDPLLHLYEDAKIRNSKKQELQKINQESLKNQVNSTAKQSLEKHNKFLMQKFIKDFEEGLDLMFQFTFDCSNKNQQISFEQFVQILHSMKFIPQQPASINQFMQTEDNENILHMWHVLQYDQKVYSRNLLLMLLALQKLYNTDHNEMLRSFKPLDNFDNQQQEQLQTEYGFIFDQYGNLILGNSDNKKINSQFQCLYKSYMQNKQRRTQVEDFSYQPKISEISTLLAQHAKQLVINEMKSEQYIRHQNFNEEDIENPQSYQNKQELIEQQSDQNQLQKNISIPLSQILLYKKSKSLQEINMKRQQLIMQEQEGCTFKPKVLQKSTKQNNQKQTKAKKGVHRSIQLYQLSKNSSKQSRINKSSNEIEYEKYCDECTFQPEINQYVPPVRTVKTIQDSEDFENVVVIQGKPSSIQKAIERMRLARLQKLQTEEVKTKGSTQNDNKRDNLMKYVQQKDQLEMDLIRSYRFQIRKDKIQLDQDKDEAGNQEGQLREEDFQNYNEHSLQYTDNLTQQDQSKQYEQIKLSTQLEPQEIQENQLHQQSSQQQEIQYETIENLQDYGITRNEIPLLLVDVHIAEGKTDKIMIFEGDKAEDLAQKFAEQHNLEEQMKGKLVELLQQQMSGILCKIDEEEEEEYQDERKYQQHYQDQ